MEKNRFIILFADGVEISIDDGKIETWEQGENFVSVKLKDGREYYFDVSNRMFYEVSCNERAISKK